MLWSLLVASFSVGSFADFCRPNANATACEAATVTNCVSVCNLYKNQNPCLATAGCDWTSINYGGTIIYSCTPTNSSSCGSYSNETVCAANSMCSWKTTPCKYKPSCKPINTSSCITLDSMTDADCTNQPGCAMKGDCSASDRCGIIDDQGGCTGSAGCYWGTGQINAYGMTVNVSNCDMCFNDLSNTGNTYQTVVSHINQTCTMATFGSTVTTKIWSAVAASSGCTGGSLVADGMNCTDNTNNNNNTNTNNNNTNTNNTNTNNTNTNNTNTDNNNTNTNNNNTNNNNTNNSNNTNNNNNNINSAVGLSFSVALLFLAMSLV